MEILRQFATASEPAQEGGLLEMLGIDWKILIFQIVAFLVTVWILAKFVYPFLMKSVDDREAKIEASAKAAAEVQAASQDTEKRIAKLMSKAQVEASGIVASAKAESAATLAATEEKSRKRAEQIAADAQVQIEKEVLAAKKALREETIELVALATEKVVGKVVAKDIDNALIADAIKDIKK